MLQQYANPSFHEPVAPTGQGHDGTPAVGLSTDAMSPPAT